MFLDYFRGKEVNSLNIRIKICRRSIKNLWKSSKIKMHNSRMKLNDVAQIAFLKFKIIIKTPPESKICSKLTKICHVCGWPCHVSNFEHVFLLCASAVVVNFESDLAGLRLISWGPLFISWQIHYEMQARENTLCIYSIIFIF